MITPAGRACSGKAPITAHCANVITCVNALHPQCCQTARLEDDDTGELFCSKECMHFWINHQQGPNPPHAWHMTSQRTVVKVKDMFLEENQLQDSDSILAVVRHTLKIHIQVQGKGVQEFLHKLKRDKFQRRAVMAMWTHLQDKELETMKAHLLSFWPDTPMPTQSSNKPNSDPKSGAPASSS